MNSRKSKTPNPPAADTEPLKPFHGDHVTSTASGELHSLEFPADLTSDWDSLQRSLGRGNFAADHILDGVPEDVNLLRHSGSVQAHHTTPPGLQAARHGVIPRNRLPEVSLMDPMTQIRKDDELFGRLDLALLRHEVVAHDDGIADLVGRHNDDVTEMSERLSRLADDRRDLADFGAWADGTLDSLLTERARLAREGWNWLLDLRQLLAERQALLAKAEDVIERRLEELDRRRQQVLADLRRSMAKICREMVQANPSRGESHFTDELEGNEAVIAIDRKRATLQSGLEWVTDRRRRVSADQASVVMRQQEIFKGLVEASL